MYIVEDMQARSTSHNDSYIHIMKFQQIFLRRQMHLHLKSHQSIMKFYQESQICTNTPQIIATLHAGTHLSDQLCFKITDVIHTCTGPYLFVLARFGFMINFKGGRALLITAHPVFCIGIQKGRQTIAHLKCSHNPFFAIAAPMLHLLFGLHQKRRTLLDLFLTYCKLV